MKTLLSAATLILIILSACNAQSYPDHTRESMRFPKDSALLNVKDSILIGKYFVAVKGHFYSDANPINPVNFKVFIQGYEYSEEVSLQDLKHNFKLLSSDATRPALNGIVALLKTNNAANSTNYQTNFSGLTSLPKIEILEPGDLIAFVGVISYDGKQMYTFPSRWYKVVK